MLSSASNKQKIFIYPTDTAYALGCDARDEQAIKKILEIKGRVESKTMPLIASSIGMVRDWCELSGKAEELAEKYWPGPLTLVLPVKRRRDSIARRGGGLQNDDEKNDGLSSFAISNGCAAIRVPDSEEARALSEKLGAPIVSTSANRSGDANCYSIEEARASLGEAMNQVDSIIDIGALEKKEPSTIVKIVDDEIIIMRKGGIMIPSELQ